MVIMSVPLQGECFMWHEDHMTVGALVLDICKKTQTMWQTSWRMRQIHPHGPLLAVWTKTSFSFLLCKRMLLLICVSFVDNTT